MVVNHGIHPLILDTAYLSTQMLFAHSDEELRRYETPENGRQSGFTPFGVEHAKDSAHPDLKRFWHIHDPRRLNPPVPNIWPTALVEHFEDIMSELFVALDQVGIQLLGVLERYLEEKPGTLTGMVGGGETLLRVLHYPTIAAGQTGQRSAPHEDINLITLLVAATASGLEVKTRDDLWVPVEETPGSIVVNVGDMLQMYTGGRLVSTSHRVVNGVGERYSLPFFVHPRSEVVLDTSTGYTAGAYLMQRLREIGLY